MLFTLKLYAPETREVKEFTEDGAALVVAISKSIISIPSILVNVTPYGTVDVVKAFLAGTFW